MEPIAIFRQQVIAIAVRALMQTHPNPSALRDVWDQLVSAEIWGFYAQKIGSPDGIPPGVREEMQEELARWETWIPKP